MRMALAIGESLRVSARVSGVRSQPEAMVVGGRLPEASPKGAEQNATRNPYGCSRTPVALSCYSAKQRFHPSQRRCCGERIAPKHERTREFCRTRENRANPFATAPKAKSPVALASGLSR